MPGIAAKYLPSFFECRIPTPDTIYNLLDASANIQALWYHEYIHFLQNITTTSGLLRTWLTYDRIRQLIITVQRENESISLPLKGATVTEHTRFFQLMRKLSGGYNLEEIPSIESGYEISHIELVDDDLLQQTIKSDQPKLVKLTLSHPELNDKLYFFGEDAIAESMAYLMEARHFQIQPPLRYPYRVAELVAQAIYLPISYDPEYMVALCDTALMHPIPAWAFHQILSAMAEQRLAIQRAEDIIDFGRKLYAQRGWNIDRQLQRARDGLQGVLQSLIPTNTPIFMETKEWFSIIINRAVDLRETRYQFILKLFHAPAGLDGYMHDIVYNLGGPNCRNGINELAMLRPHDTGLNEINIQPHWLKALEQMHNFLLMPHVARECSMLDICKAHQNDLVDHRCKTAPWIRATDGQLCPFAAAWRMYGFHEKNLTIYDHPI